MKSTSLFSLDTETEVITKLSIKQRKRAAPAHARARAY